MFVIHIGVNSAGGRLLFHSGYVSSHNCPSFATGKWFIAVFQWNTWNPFWALGLGTLRNVAPFVAPWIAISYKRARQCSSVAPCTGGEATLVLLLNSLSPHQLSIPLKTATIL